MRVYEFAKRRDIPAKDLLALLKKGGFDVANHMAILAPAALQYLEKSLQEAKASDKKSLAKPTSKKQSKREPLPSTVQKQKSAKPSVAETAPQQNKSVTKSVAKKTESRVPSTKIKESAPLVTKTAEPSITPKLAVPPQPVVTPKPVPEVTPVVTKPTLSVTTPPNSVVPPSVAPTLPPAARAPLRPEAPAIPVIVQARAMTVDQAAQTLRLPVSEVMITLLRKGVVATKNQMISDKVVADLARHYGAEVVQATQAVPEATTKTVLHAKDNLKERTPVIVVMGHVDHGKTTLLDYIRKTRVAAREKGGITQHLGAYEITTSHGPLVFLDTPGHQAFSQIRVRGSKAADIAVLVVAADDSVKPQTVEALKIAQAAELPIIVAVNKIDKAAPERIDVVKRDLTKYDILPEEWGGTSVFVPISAKVGTGVDNLLEILALQAQVMELKADPSVPGRGFVLESKVEKGRGSVATVICQEGTIRLGDFFICGSTQGKVTALVDSYGNRVVSVGPSQPVQVSGFEELAHVGDPFDTVDQEQYRRARAEKAERRMPMPQPSADEKALHFIVKADAHGSLEAILGVLPGLPDKGDKKINIVHTGVGPINESDVMLAATTGATIIGLHVRPEPNAAMLAQQHTVAIDVYDIIYQLFDAVKATLAGTRERVMVKQKTGEAEVRKVFDIKGLGVIAGCYVKDGRITRDGIVTVWRGRDKVGAGTIKSLQRDRKTVKEIHAGFECAFMVDGFDEWQEGDRVECFVEVPQEKV